MPTGSVIALARVKIMAIRNSFQEKMKQSTPVATRPGVIIGSTIRRRWLAGVLLVLSALAAGRDYVFASIEGGNLNMSDWAGQAVLVVNTASQCGFTGQYEGLQALYDRYREQGLVVLAVPSDDFNQELDSAEEVKEFCEITYGLNLPMTDITSIKGDRAHPFYADVRAETGFAPRWNFNKVLIGPDGAVVGTLGATDPEGDTLTYTVDDARFEVVGGQLKLKAGEVLDHERQPRCQRHMRDLRRGVELVLVLDGDGVLLGRDRGVGVLTRRLAAW